MSRLSAPASDPDSHLWTKLSVATLAVALALRLALAWGGGQGSWPDESRFLSAREAMIQFSLGHPKVAWLAMIGSADHPFFKVASLPAALGDRLFGTSDRRAAAYLGLYSVALLALIGASTRAAGASRREAWLAVFFATGANSLFYYTRHLLPYDVSLAFCMGSLALAMGPTSALRSFFAGFLAGLGFLTYDGYWMLGGVILVIHVLRAPRFRESVLRAAAAGAGLAVPIASIVGAARILGGDLAGSFRHFSGTITQGDFGRGHAFVWQYLWSAEGWVLVFWLAAAGYAVGRICQEAALARPAAWLGAAAALFVGLWACADILKVFVVYGRTARMLVPFLCLAAAWSVDDLWSRRRWNLGPLLGLAAAVGAVAAFNEAKPLRLVFPAQFNAEAAAIVRKSGPGVFRLLNATWLGPNERVQSDDSPGELLLVHRHPLQYAPYLFEGFTEAERRYLASHDLTMRLKGRLASRLPSEMGGYPGPLRFKVRFPQDRQGTTEPLVTAGTGPEACHAFVKYVDAGHVVFGYESPDEDPLLSAAAPADFQADHELLIFFGSMLPAIRPPGGSGTTNPDWERMRQTLFVVLDDRVMLAAKVKAHESRPNEITAGIDLTGYSQPGTCFSGSILSIRPVGLDEVVGRLRDEPASHLRSAPEWGGYPGPLHILVQLPANRVAASEPVVTAGTTPFADSLNLVIGDNGDVRLRLSRFGSTRMESEPLQVGPDGRLDLYVSMGALMPPEGSPLYGLHPKWAMLRCQVWVEANGRTVLAGTSEGSLVEPGDLRLFSNLAGVPAVGAYFTSRIETAEPMDPSAIIGRIPPLGLGPASPALPLDGYPGAILLKVSFPAQTGAAAEPLVVSGVPGAGDQVFVKYSGGAGVRFGVDHWFTGGPLSDLILPAPGPQLHDVVISEGGLYPPPESPLYALHPQWRKLRDWLVVALDGRPVVVAPCKAYASRPDQITTCLNLIGGSTVGTRFRGEVGRTELVSPEVILAWVDGARAIRP